MKFIICVSTFFTTTHAFSLATYNEANKLYKDDPLTSILPHIFWIFLFLCSFYTVCSILEPILSNLHNERTTILEILFENKNKKPVASDFGFGFLCSIIIPIFYIVTNEKNDLFSISIILLCDLFWISYIQIHRIFRKVFDTLQIQTNISERYNGTKFLLVLLSYKSLFSYFLGINQFKVFYILVFILVLIYPSLFPSNHN